MLIIKILPYERLKSMIFIPQQIIKQFNKSTTYTALYITNYS